MTDAIGLDSHFTYTRLAPSKAAWTFNWLNLIYPGVIGKQLFSVTFQVRGLPWQSNMRKGASAT